MWQRRWCPNQRRRWASVFKERRLWAIQTCRRFAMSSEVQHGHLLDAQTSSEGQAQTSRSGGGWGTVRASQPKHVRPSRPTHIKQLGPSTWMARPGKTYTTFANVFVFVLANSPDMFSTYLVYSIKRAVPMVYQHAVDHHARHARLAEPLQF